MYYKDYFMQYQKVIEQLGYSQKESKVYVTLLRLGESHVLEIAQKVAMACNTSRAIIGTLYADGLMSFYVLRRYKYWSVENLERLLTNLKRQEEIERAALFALTELRKITRKKTSKKNPQHAVTMIRAWADSSEQSMLITDEDANILYVNTLWEKHIGVFAFMVGINSKLIAPYFSWNTIKCILGLGYVEYALLMIRAVLLEWSVWKSWLRTFEVILQDVWSYPLLLYVFYSSVFQSLFISHLEENVKKVSWILKSNNVAV